MRVGRHFLELLSLYESFAEVVLELVGRGLDVLSDLVEILIEGFLGDF